MFLDSQDNLGEGQQKYMNYRMEVVSVCYEAGASKKGAEGPPLSGKDKEAKGQLYYVGACFEALCKGVLTAASDFSCNFFVS